MKSKQFVAGLLAAALLLGGFPTQQEALAAEGTSAQDLFNKEGVWLTEIYQNDVDRSKETTPGNPADMRASICMIQPLT